MGDGMQHTTFEAGPDLKAAAAFLHKLDPDAPFWTFQTFDDDKARKDDALARVFHGSLNDHEGELWRLQRRGAGVFVTVNETDGIGRKEANIVRVRAHFLDLDGPPIDPVLKWEPPHILVQSSPGKWQAYWKVTGAGLKDFGPVQAELAAAFEGDNVRDLPRVLRLPGFYHQKGAPVLVQEAETGSFPAPFTAAQFRDRVASVRPQRDRKPIIDLGRATPVQMPAANAPNAAEVAEALNHIPCSALAYGEWFAVLAGLHDAFGDAGQGMAETWSAMDAERFRPGEVAHKWRGIGRHTGARATVATIMHLARQNGCNLSELARKHMGARPDGKAPRATRQNSPAKAMAETLSLVTDRGGHPFWNTANAVEILAKHEAFQGVFGFNEFTRRRMVLKPIPGTKTGGGRNLEDDDTTAVLTWFNRNGFPRATATVAVAAVHAVARRQSFDPLKDFLTGLVWDGAKRLDSWLTSYCGAEASDYTREVGRRWLISAVARGLKPGVKADHMLVLEGEQGARKSSALATLAGEEWFSDALPPMNTKDASSYLRGKWIVEVAELEAMRREMDAVKAFISRQVESYRPAYGREEVDEPRRCIFAGTTNKDAWLRDETGGRRFWPVKVGHIDLDAIKANRAQLWAEAVAAYRAGERHWLEGEAEAEARVQQSTRMAEDPWAEVIEAETQGCNEITIRELLGKLGLLASEQERKHSDRVASLLRRAGWQRGARMTAGPHKGQITYNRPA